MTALLFVLAGLAAVGDWWAVHQRLFRVEYLLKPLALALLIAAAAGADFPGGVKTPVLIALALSLIGDIALMLTAPAPGVVDTPFLVGLLAFLAAHVAYLVAFASAGLHSGQLLGGVLIVVGIAALTLPLVLLHVHRAEGSVATAAIALYSGVAGAMAVLAIGTALALTALGGIVFLLSDSALASNRFVRRLPHADVIVAVTYHAAQVLIVLGLATA